MIEWRVETGDGCHQAFATMPDAERYAKKLRTVAYVLLDALDRVWVDVVDASVA